MTSNSWLDVGGDQIRITARMQEFLNGILSLWDRTILWFFFWKNKQKVEVVDEFFLRNVQGLGCLTSKKKSILVLIRIIIKI